jgi:hypothetical protein
MRPTKHFLLCLIFFALLPFLSIAQQKQQELLSPEELEEYKQRVKQLISFFEFSINTIGDPSTPQAQKDVIINESFLKAFRDAKVQVEDDLVPNRESPTNKDIQAYMKDIDFFFREANFKFDIKNIDSYVNEEGKTFFRVEMNRHLKSLDYEGRVIDHDMLRYVEINLDLVRKDLKIASIYTTRLTEREDLTNWWNTLSEDWKLILAEEIMVTSNLPMNEVLFINDTTLVLSDKEVQVETTQIFNTLKRLAGRESLDISGKMQLRDGAPLERLENLRVLRMGNTGIADLSPIRNLNKIEVLDVSNTLLNDLSPLQYSTSLRELNLSGTLVQNLTPLFGLENLERLYLNNTNPSDFKQLTKLPALQDIRLSGVNIPDLNFVMEIPRLQTLMISNTAVADLSPLSGHPGLIQIFCDNTPISTLEGFGAVPNLRRLYMDNTRVSVAETNRFRQKNPGVLIIYQSDNLKLWWDNLPAFWKSIFLGYVKINGKEPNKEELAEIGYLNEINLSANPLINSLEALRPLIFLQRLDFSHTEVESMDPLSDLRDLRIINASHSQVSDLRSLTLLTNLNSLHLVNTPIESLVGLESLLELRTLSIDSTSIRDLNPLYSLKKLELLSAEATGIGDTEVRQLWEQVPDVLAIYKTTELKIWYESLSDTWKNVFGQNTILDQEPTPNQLHRLYSIRKVEISPQSQLVNLEPLAYLPRIEELTAIDSRISDLRPLSNHKEMRVLRLSRNPITSIQALSGMSKLRTLELDNTAVAELEPLQRLALLEELSISGTNVKRINALSGLYKLRFLDISNTQVRALKPVMALQDLQTLRCFNTKISSKQVAEIRAKIPGCDVLHY